MVHQILLLLSTNAYKHTDTHIHIQQLQVHFISTSLLLIHICLLPRLKHTHTHTQTENLENRQTHQQTYGLITSKAISNIASKLNQKVLLKHMPDLFSDIGLPDLVCIVWNVAICFFFKGRLPFLMQLLP